MTADSALRQVGDENIKKKKKDFLEYSGNMREINIMERTKQ